MPDDPAEDGEEQEQDDDPVDAIFRIIAQYYEGVTKREDEGIGAE